MRTQETIRSVSTGLAAPAEEAAVTELAHRREAPVSDAPLYAPECVAGGKGGGALLLLAPREPREPKQKS